MSDGTKASKQASSKRCFVISPLGEVGSETRRKADDFLQYIVLACPAITEAAYEVLRADKLNEPGRITSQITRAIVEADLVIADVTGANPNVYYEMALRHAVGKALIVCAEDPTTLPFDTRDNRTVFYTMHSRRAEEARAELDRQIQAINKEGFKPDNPIADANGIINLASTGQEGSALVLERLAEIASRLGTLENQQRVITTRGFIAATPVAVADKSVEAAEAWNLYKTLSEAALTPKDRQQLFVLAEAGRKIADRQMKGD
jgi:hypothetical protein